MLNYTLQLQVAGFETSKTSHTTLRIIQESGSLPSSLDQSSNEKSEVHLKVQSKSINSVCVVQRRERDGES